MNSVPTFRGRLANPAVTGRLISDPARRQDWLELVQALQIASETSGGALEGWVFHGSAGAALSQIDRMGLVGGAAHVPSLGGGWEISRGVHFATANVAAFFAEDRIESSGDPLLELAIYGVPLEVALSYGSAAPDGQMLDVPIFSRLRLGEEAVLPALESCTSSWEACFKHLETLVLLGDIPAVELTCFRSVDDVRELEARHLSLVRRNRPR